MTTPETSLVRRDSPKPRFSSDTPSPKRKLSVRSFSDLGPKSSDDKGLKLSTSLLLGPLNQINEGLQKLPEAKFLRDSLDKLLEITNAFCEATRQPKLLFAVPQISKVKEKELRNFAALIQKKCKEYEGKQDGHWTASEVNALKDEVKHILNLANQVFNEKNRLQEAQKLIVANIGLDPLQPLASKGNKKILISFFGQKKRPKLLSCRQVAKEIKTNGIQGFLSKHGVMPLLLAIDFLHMQQNSLDRELALTILKAECFLFVEILAAVSKLSWAAGYASEIGSDQDLPEWMREFKKIVAQGSALAIPLGSVIGQIRGQLLGRLKKAIEEFHLIPGHAEQAGIWSYNELKKSQWDSLTRCNQYFRKPIDPESMQRALENVFIKDSADECVFNTQNIKNQNPKIYQTEPVLVEVEKALGRYLFEDRSETLFANLRRAAAEVLFEEGEAPSILEVHLAVVRIFGALVEGYILHKEEEVDPKRKKLLQQIEEKLRKSNPDNVEKFSTRQIIRYLIIFYNGLQPDLARKGIQTIAKNTLAVFPDSADIKAFRETIPQTILTCKDKELEFRFLFDRYVCSGNVLLKSDLRISLPLPLPVTSQETTGTGKITQSLTYAIKPDVDAKTRLAAEQVVDKLVLVMNHMKFSGSRALKRGTEWVDPQENCLP